ncbi:hypothetical protein M885DRAFT_540456 [Pelagophyceae sp. CCMP2097]|nr:hypothetical protein M885DRAFT_540456 [Pelagophyceae sp. CCMP2097]
MVRKERVRYVVPEDGDDFEHPNVFELQNTSVLRLGDVRRAFPLRGAFHFRFKRKVAGLVIWADAAGDAAEVPRFEGIVFAKVSRVTNLETALDANARRAHQALASAAPALEDDAARRGNGHAHHGHHAPEPQAARQQQQPQQPPPQQQHSPPRPAPRQAPQFDSSPRAQYDAPPAPPAFLPPPAVRSPPPVARVPAAAASDLLGFDTPDAAPQGPNDWQAFVGLDATANAAAPPAMMPQRPVDPFFVPPQQPPPRSASATGFQQGGFDAFAGFNTAHSAGNLRSPPPPAPGNLRGNDPFQQGF